jgi:diguanylate cyclase (GGDEF)-like protein
MNDQSVTSKELKATKQKLANAIKARASLEEDFKRQTQLLLEFISKLSHACKGQDLKLDNRLASFRTLLNKSVAFDSLEKEIEVLSQLLLSFAAQNEQNIRELDQQFKQAGKALQQVKGLPDNVRRELRTLLKQNEEKQHNIIQYVPLLRQLLTLYGQALAAKNGGVFEEPSNSSDNTINCVASDDMVEKFSTLLSHIILSDSQQKKLAKIQHHLSDNSSISHDDLINYLLTTFDLLSENLQQERVSAESFLTSLNDTLATVKAAVKKTLLSQSESKKAYQALSDKLDKQLDEMSKTINQKGSLVDLKDEINQKLHQITEVIAEKSELEQKNQQLLERQLAVMQKQIISLEARSKNFEAKLHEQHLKSMQDALTKLANRAAFDEEFAKAIVKHHKKHCDLAIAVIDLDNFKSINDTYGHTAGDKTLQIIAKTMKQFANDNMFVARYGGEEFVMICTQMTKAQVVQILDRIRSKVEALPFKFKDKPVTITISIGVTHITEDDNIHTAFERADEGLYQAKAQGKNQVVYVDNK